MPCVVWAEESKAGLGFEIESPQLKSYRKPSLQSPAVNCKQFSKLFCVKLCSKFQTF